MTFVAENLSVAVQAVQIAVYVLEVFYSYPLLALAACETVLVEWLLAKHEPFVIFDGLTAFLTADTYIT